MTLFDYTKLRIIQESESDYDSPGSEELHSQYRENIESLLHLGYFADSSGTVKTAATSSAVSKCTNLKCTGGASWSDDDHNNRTIVFIDGNAAGNYYKIDDSSGTTPKLKMNDDNLVSDGVSTGDSFKIFYNLLSTAGHTHDGVDAAEVNLPTGRAGIGFHPWHSSGYVAELASSFTTSKGWVIVATSNSWKSMINQYVYIPNNASKVHAKILWAATAGGKIRVAIDSSNVKLGSSSSGAVITKWTSFAGTVDVSTIAAGWHTVIIQGRPDDDVDKVHIKGYSLCWGT